MAVPTHMQGVRWRLYADEGQGGFSYLCSITTQDLDRKVEFDDNMVADCDTPNALPVRVSTPKGITWDVTFSGKVDASRYRWLENMLETASVGLFRFLKDLPAAAGGGTQTGNGYVDSLKQTKTENGVVSFSGSIKGQGTLAWAPADA